MESSLRRRHRLSLFTPVALAAIVLCARANGPGTPLHYVSTNGTAMHPYTNWATAALVIQDAVDACLPGDTVLVSNGLYSVGGRPAPGSSLTNRVCLTNAVTVRSMNGWSNTVIVGAAHTGTPHGDTAARCAFLVGGSLVSGFTLTNGHTRSVDNIDADAGGALCSMGGTVSNCLVSSNAAYRDGGGVLLQDDGFVADCAFVVNTAVWGGGILIDTAGVVSNCSFVGQTAVLGGGVYCFDGGVVAGCVFTNNLADDMGGGAYLEDGGTVDGSRFDGNLAPSGGGVAISSIGAVTASDFTTNGAIWGGGVFCEEGGQVTGGTFTGNGADDGGGGVYLYYGGTVDGARFVGNDAWWGGGVGFEGDGGSVSGAVLTANTASWGGGIYYYLGGSATHCTVTNNGAVPDGYADSGSGGGAGFELGGWIGHSFFGGNTGVYGGAVMCFYDDAELEACELRGNRAAQGGALWVEEGVSAVNCLIADNSATDGDGGGAYLGDAGFVGARFDHCALAGNEATTNGGGIFCFREVTLRNCVVYGNSAPTGTNWRVDDSGANVLFEYTCTTPTGGLLTAVACITDDPDFRDATAGDYTLRYASPCIDTGANLPAPVTIDLVGTPRPLDGNWNGTNAFDMGCYEYDPATADSNGDGIPDGWYHTYGIDPNSATASSGNPDTDPHTTGEEFTADTDPADSNSYFRITAITGGPPTTVSMPTSPNRVYTLQRRDSLVAGDWSAVAGQTLVPGTGGTNTLTDADGGPGRSYRALVGLP